MDDTGIPTSKAPREKRQDSCLHCVVMTAVEEYYQHHGRREEGKVVIDVLEAISKLAECSVEFIRMSDDRAQRRRAMRFAHDALDAANVSAAKGTLQMVEAPAEH